jgi:integrase
MYAGSSMASVIKREWKTKTGEQRVGWRVQYLVKGKKRFRQFSTERKAKKFAESVSIVRENELKKLVVDTSPTLAEVADQWLKTREQGLDGEPPIDPETAVWYRGLLSNHILPALGQLRIGAVQRADVRAFREGLLSARHIGRRTSKKVLVCLGSVFRFAVEAELCERNPVFGMTVREAARHRSEIEIHTLDEMTRLLQTAKRLATSRNQAVAKPWRRYYPMLLLLVYCGLRISEVRGLDCKDIDFARQTIRVRQRADRRGRLGSPKSMKGYREVHWPKLVEPELLAMVDNRMEGLVFRTRNSRPVDAANFRKRAWENVQRAAGVRMLTLHSCRHFFASRQIADGVNPKELAALLGHADEAFTLRTYGHLFQDHETIQRRRVRVESLVLT